MFRWTTEYSVNNDFLDGQHKKLFELINQFSKKVDNVKEEYLAFAITELSSYAEKHFSAEEDMLKKCDYPELVSHKGEHKEFKTRLNKFVEKFSDDNQALANEIYSYLKKWWNDHILIIDKKYVRYLEKSCIK